MAENSPDYETNPIFGREGLAMAEVRAIWLRCGDQAEGDLTLPLNWRMVGSEWDFVRKGHETAFFPKQTYREIPLKGL